MKKTVIGFICLASFVAIGTTAYAQEVVGISGGLGAGSLTHQFTQDNRPANFTFSAPGANLALELISSFNPLLWHEVTNIYE